MIRERREDLMDAATAVAGSGPAYVFYLAEAMEEAARKLGFTPEDARRLVRDDHRLATAMMSESSDAPSDLRAMVTSKGGTTAAACDTLDTLGVRAAFVQAVEAAQVRGRTGHVGLRNDRRAGTPGQAAGLLVLFRQALAPTPLGSPKMASDSDDIRALAHGDLVVVAHADAQDVERSISEVHRAHLFVEVAQP